MHYQYMINSKFTIWHYKLSIYQTWSSRDLSLGLETSPDPFLQVLVSVLVLNLGVLVLVLVLEPQSLGLALGLGTLESWSRPWSLDLGPWRLGLRHT